MDKIKLNKHFILGSSSSRRLGLLSQIGIKPDLILSPNIDEKINSEHKRGWGLQLMKELMDTVEFESSEAGTTVTMTKNK